MISRGLLELELIGQLLVQRTVPATESFTRNQKEALVWPDGRYAARGSNRRCLDLGLNLDLQALTRREKNKGSTVFFSDFADPVIVELVAIVA
jgi:hypothetical protein